MMHTPPIAIRIDTRDTDAHTANSVLGLIVEWPEEFISIDILSNVEVVRPLPAWAQDERGVWVQIRVKLRQHIGWLRVARSGSEY